MINTPTFVPILDAVTRGRHHEIERGFGHGPGPFIAAVVGLLVLGGIIALIVWLVRRNRSADVAAAPVAAPQLSAQESAMAVLQQRLAAGDISTDDYLERSRVLRGEMPETKQPE